MPVIKRYSNRKLYDTDSKRYVTLEDLAGSIRRGEDLRVVDHQSGEDLTSITLMQVIFEEEKKIGGLLPQVFLKRLIRAGGHTVNALRSRLLAMDPFQMVDEEIRHRVQNLVEQGKLDYTEGTRLEEMLLRRSGPADAVHIPVKGEDEETDQPLGVRVYVEAILDKPEADEPQQADPEAVEALLRQLDGLEKELERLKQSSGPVHS